MTPTPQPNPLIKLMREQFVSGAFGGFILCCGILYFDIAQFYTLAGAADDGWLFIVMLFFSLMTFFGTVAMSVGIMRLGTFSDNADYRDERTTDPSLPDDQQR